MSPSKTSTEDTAKEGQRLHNHKPLAGPDAHPTMCTIDDLLLSRCRTIPDIPLVAYPATAKGKADYAHYTAKDLDRFADEGAKRYISMGLVPEEDRLSGPEAETVALLAPSNLDYIACIFALSRMGFAVLLLSNRLSTEGYISLLRKTKCHNIISSENQNKTVLAIQAEIEVVRYPLLEKNEYDVPKSSIRFSSHCPEESDTARTAFIIHSSGSTGLPKPIFQSHSACLSNYSSSFGYRAFLTLPLYHNHGLSSFFRAVYSGKEISMFNANLPLSESNLVEAMKEVKPESFHGVPYALKLLAETERGIQVLRDCKLVLFGGSSCPDDLGDRLVEAGVYLVGHYGATEIGQLMTSFRPKEDKAWNYVRPLPAVEPYIQMVSRASNTFECVVLDGLPSKVVSNWDDPPKSFRTSDLFSPHPTIPSAWKFLGRLDDRVTLVNGEKVLPLPYEHQLRENELIREACVFGIGRSFPGVIIVSSEKATGMSKEESFDKIWTAVQAANSRVESFSQVSREMIEILHAGTVYPCTDKGTMIRAAFYKKFAELIDNVYLRFEAPAADQNGSGLVLNPAELRGYLISVFQKLGFAELNETTDFFEVGLDSLQAITVRGVLMRELDLASNTLGQNVVFEYPNVEVLAEYLYSIRTGTELGKKDEIKVMGELIQKYSMFSPHIPVSSVVDDEVVILTGATGSLGAHVLAQLCERNNVKAVYCLVRAKSKENARDRVISTLASKGIGALANMSKVLCFPSDLSHPDLGLDSSTIETLRSNLTTVIHCAWAVNFNLGVQSFEQQHIKGTFNLLNLCLAVTTTLPAKLFFCSSISAAAGTPIPGLIEETYISDLSHAQNMGYARSKLVTETIVKAAADQTGMVARVLRVGQIVGDTKMGIWNSTEAISLMIRSAVTIGALPALDETPSWLPVDIVAKAILDLAGINSSAFQTSSTVEGESSEVVYHVQNSQLFHWTDDLLPALRDAGLEFETVLQREWVRRLRESEKDPGKNPTIKLLDFFARKYDNDKPGRKGLVFITEKTGKKSEAIRNGYDIIGSGLVRKFVESWRNEFEVGGES